LGVIIPPLWGRVAGRRPAGWGRRPPPRPFGPTLPRWGREDSRAAACPVERENARLRAAADSAYRGTLMNVVAKSSFVLNRRHLLGIEGLSHEEILGLLELAEEFVDLNRQ